jgi:hypothetical protein
MAPCIIIGERAAEALRNQHRLETSSVSRSAKVIEQIRSSSTQRLKLEPSSSIVSSAPL